MGEMIELRLRVLRLRARKCDSSIISDVTVEVVLHRDCRPLHYRPPRVSVLVASVAARREVKNVLRMKPVDHPFTCTLSHQALPAAPNTKLTKWSTISVDPLVVLEARPSSSKILRQI